jgi:four helix bundle protein
MSVKSYRDLRVWQASIALSHDIYAVTARFPNCETFGLSQQLRRAAVSVASNVAEGHARGGTREFLRFLAIARGSLAEIDTQLTIAFRLGYVVDRDVAHLSSSIDVVSRMLRRLEQTLARRLRE